MNKNKEITYAAVSTRYLIVINIIARITLQALLVGITIPLTKFAILYFTT